MQIRTEDQHPATKSSAAAKYGQLGPLTELRGVAACSVLIAHAFETSFNSAAGSIFHPFASRLANFGMSLFFVLSGFGMRPSDPGSAS
jgi:peptidoglycan/LPS O-acetylase OafA/YrhL